MTTTFQPPGPTGARFRLPDIPEREPDDMTSFRSLHRIGISASLAQCLGHPDTTIVGAELYIVPGPAYVAGESRYPDLLVAFDVDPDAYDASNGYIVSEQGKPPDFVLEVASRRTARLDRTVKKDYYERVGSRRVLAVRPDRRVLRVSSGRVPSGTRPVSANSVA